MKNRKKYFILMMLFLMFILVLIMFAAVTLGSASIGVKESIKVVAAKLPLLKRFVSHSSQKKMYETIIWKVRMPRIIMAALVGWGLAVVGGTFQGMFRNPLADPHILGVSSGAALGATIAMLTGIQIDFLGIGVIAGFAMAGAFLTILLVYTIAHSSQGLSTTNVLLTGTVLSTLMSAIISLMMTFHRNQIEKVYMWTLGSFSAASSSKNVFLLAVIGIGSIILFSLSKELNALIIGEDSAKSLGIEAERVKRVLILVCSGMVAACVSVSGIIGFVGLIIPHCVRILFGSDHRMMLPYTAVVGAGFMVFCDTLARNLASPSEIPVGVITAILGAPYFIFLLYRRRKEGVGI